MQRFNGCFGVRDGIQARLSGVGGLIQAAVGLSGGVGGLLTKRSGLVRNAWSRVCWRMTKKQQMPWSRATMQPFLDVRTAVLNDTFEDSFRRRHPGFRPANDDRWAAAAV